MEIFVMYNMTMNEFGNLMTEYKQIEDYKIQAIRCRSEGNLELAKLYLGTYTRKRLEFVKKFQKREM